LKVVFLATAAPATDPLTTTDARLQALHRFVAFTEFRTGFGSRLLLRDIAIDNYGDRAGVKLKLDPHR
jgi:hypothetical protein